MANICDVSIKIFPTTSKDELTEEQSKVIEREFEKNFKDEYIIEEEIDVIEIEAFFKWNIEDESLEFLQKLSKKYKLRIRAIGREDMNGFIQVVCIDNGLIVQNEEINYKI